jgi:hypothetical protein
LNIEPKLQITRFKQLSPGALFIFHQKKQAIVGLKVVVDGGDELVLPLGPEDIPGHGPARLIQPNGMTVISFGKDYVLRLPTDAEGWSAEMPDGNTIAVVIEGGKAFFRANNSRITDKFDPCYVSISDGKLQFGGLSQTLGIAIRWEFAVKDSTGEFMTVLQYPPLKKVP